MVLNTAGPLVPESSSSTEEDANGSSALSDKPEEFTLRERRFLSLIQKLETELRARTSIETSSEELEMKCRRAKEERNLYEAEREVLSGLLSKADSEFAECQRVVASRRKEVGWVKEIDAAFGLTGVQVSSRKPSVTKRRQKFPKTIAPAITCDVN